MVVQWTVFISKTAGIFSSIPRLYLVPSFLSRVLNVLIAMSCLLFLFLDFAGRSLGNFFRSWLHQLLHQYFWRMKALLFGFSWKGYVRYLFVLDRYFFEWQLKHFFLSSYFDHTWPFFIFFEKTGFFGCFRANSNLSDSTRSFLEFFAHSTANRSRKITTKRNSPEVCFCMTFLGSKTFGRKLDWSPTGQGTLIGLLR